LLHMNSETRVYLLASKALKHRITAKAKKEKMSMGEVIRRAIEAYCS
jgi:hypothetical protein